MINSSPPPNTGPLAPFSRYSIAHHLTRLPGVKFLNKLNIGWKLNIGFGLLVTLTLLVVILSFIGSREATTNINLTGDLRVPSALASAQAQTSLLEMVANIRGYLVLGDPQLIDDYNQSKQRFEENLLEMEQLALATPDPENERRLTELKAIFDTWSALSEQLFELHNNSRKNQPALSIYHSEVRPLSVAILIDMGYMIQLQKQRETSIESTDLLNNMIDFQTSFEAMMTDLHAYAAVNDLSFKSGYMSRLPFNTAAWENMRQRKDSLSREQQARLDSIAVAREKLFELPFQVFEVNQGERAYEDLYLFRTKSAPQAQQLLQILNEMTVEQQILLQADLNKGRQGLTNAQIQTFTGGFLVFILGISMALIFKAIIAGPIHRLTNTAEQIASGDLSTQARVESSDEIGQLATMLNYMTNHLQKTVGSLEKQAQQLETLVEISQRLTSKLDVADLASTVVRRIKSGFDFYHTLIYFLDDERNLLIATKDVGPSGAELNAGADEVSLDAEESLVAMAARLGKTMSVDDVEQSTTWRPNPLFPHTRSEMAVPILIEEQVVGVLDVHQNEVAGFGEYDAKLMRSLANYVAVGLTNANLFEQTQNALAETEKLYRMSQGMMSARNLPELIAVIVKEGNIPVINRAVLNIFEYNKYGQVEEMEVIANWYTGHGTRPSPPGTRYVQAIHSVINLFSSRTPLFFTNAQQDERVDPATSKVVRQLNIQAMAVLPLWSQDRQIGILLLEGDEPYHFTQSEIRPYLSLLGQLTVAVENHRLLEQTQQRAVELAQAKEVAETASRAKSDFLASMSHELRTPLNSILGYTQILKRDETLSPSQATGVDIIHNSGEHLLVLINDILDLSVIEAGKLKLYPNETRLSYFLDGIVDMFSLQTQQETNITFMYQPSTPLPAIVQVDERRLRQILINLIGNAIKFTRQGEVIFKVDVLSQSSFADNKGYLTQERIRFEIADTGIGMTAEQLERIFLPFEQVGDTVHRAKGTGLGLTITQNLLEAMDSSLEVKSELGKGSVFTFDLEVPVIWDAHEPEHISEQVIIGYTGPSKKILIVDDEQLNRSMLTHLLEPLEFEIIEAKDGEEGVTQAQVNRPDLILMDLVMPKMTGFEAAQQIRQISEIENVVIIAVSANTSVNDKSSEISKAEFNDFLGKPVKEKALFDLLNTHLNLEWVYKTADLAGASGPLASETGESTLLPPPPTEIAVLFDLAMKGELPRLKERATQIEQMDDKFKPFAQKLSRLVDRFDEHAILRLIEQYLE